MSNKESNMISSICSMCGYYIKYLNKNTTYCDKKHSECVLSLHTKIWDILSDPESFNDHKPRLKICKNCRYAVNLYNNQNSQCYHPSSNRFTTLKYNSCNLWESEENVK